MSYMSLDRLTKRRMLAFLVAVMLLGLWAPRAEAQTFSPYTDFQAMSLQELETLQVELSPQGVQRGGLLPVTFTSTVNTIDMTKFVPFHRAGFSFASSPGITFQATTTQLKAVIDNVGTLPNVTAGGVASPPSLAFTLVNLGKGFQAILNQADATALFEKLRLSLDGNRNAQLALSYLACPLDLLPPGNATDVSANVNVALSGVRLNRTTGRFVGTATLTNNSGAALAKPISVVLLLANNVRLANADGTTCRTDPIGVGFVNIPLTANSLAPGGTAQVNLELDNPDKLPITATTKVLAGPGVR